MGNKTCNVCDGSGRYPIHNNNGKELYTIECPECAGFGHDFSDCIDCKHATI
jgi:DnaJ-class molecular chaperone